MLKGALIIFGTISLFLGVSGIFIPGLPTTPFLLLTAGCYIRSSEKLYKKLVENRIVGPYLKEFYIKKGMTVKLKIFSIFLMWMMISISSIFFITAFLLKLILGVVGLIGTIVMALIVPTIK